jgi:hypothetical protein
MKVRTQIKAGPSFVNPDTCDGCKALDKTACQHLDPNDTGGQ